MLDIRLYILGGLASLVVIALVYLLVALAQHRRALRRARDERPRVPDEPHYVALDAFTETAPSVDPVAPAEPVVVPAPVAPMPVAPAPVVPAEPEGPVIPGADGLFASVERPAQRFPLLMQEPPQVPSLPVTSAPPIAPAAPDASSARADVPIYVPVSAVELVFTAGGGPVGVKPGTRTFLEFQRMGDAMLAELARARRR